MANLKMETERGSSVTSDFYKMVALALARLKKQLQHDYEQAHPELRDTVPLILDQEERRAWEISSFPHLLLPGLFEAQIANLREQLNLRREEPTNALSKWSGRDAHPIAEVPAFEIGWAHPETMREV